MGGASVHALPAAWFQQEAYLHLTDMPPLPTEAQTGLSDSEARLRALFESAMDGIVTIDATQRIVLFNKAAERMFRCEAAQALGHPITRFMPQRFRGQHAAHVEAFGTTGITTRRMGSIGAISGLRADGEEFPIEASISQVEIAGQKLFTVILRDVTERVQNELRLREQQETLAAVIDEASDAVISCDEEGRIVLFNPAAERILGAQPPACSINRWTP